MLSDHTAYVRVMIDAPIDEIWKLIRDFNGLPSYHPAIKASHIESGDGKTVGSIRYLTLDDGFVRELLLMHDDSTHSFDYAILDGSLAVKNYKASVRLTYDLVANMTICEWAANFEAGDVDRDGLIRLIEDDIFKVGFDSIQKIVCGPENFLLT